MVCSDQNDIFKLENNVYIEHVIFGELLKFKNYEIQIRLSQVRELITLLKCLSDQKNEKKKKQLAPGNSWIKRYQYDDEIKKY